MVNIRGWTPADRASVGTLCVVAICAVAGFVAYVRSDYTQVGHDQIAAINATMEQRSRTRDEQLKQRDENIQSQMRDLQTQLRDMAVKLDQLPRPETMQEIRRRLTETEGRINLLLNQLAAQQTVEATLEVRLQSLEKGKDVSLPGRR